MSRRFGKRWGVSMTENPEPRYWIPKAGKKRPTPDPYRIVSQIKAKVAKYFGTLLYEWKMGGDWKVHGSGSIEIKFQALTLRAWMDGLLRLKKADKKRKHKWMSGESAVISERAEMWVYPPQRNVEVIIWANVDETLPPEGEMTEEELGIIYGE